VTLKFIPGQPHKSFFIVALALNACPVEFPEGDPIQQGLSGGLILEGLGAFEERNRICDPTFEKRHPWPSQPYFEALKFYKCFIFPEEGVTANSTFSDYFKIWIHKS
jgi:hypothetical protein